MKPETDITSTDPRGIRLMTFRSQAPVQGNQTALYHLLKFSGNSQSAVFLLMMSVSASEQKSSSFILGSHLVRLNVEGNISGARSVGIITW